MSQPGAFVKPFETTAVKKDGKVRFRNAGDFQQWADRLREGQELIVTFERSHAIRSRLQNDLYWAGFVAPIAEYTGISPRKVHALLKAKFLPKERIDIVDRRTGEVVEQVELAQLTTTQLTKIEFSAYLSAIEEWVIDEFHGAVVVGSRRDQVA